MDYCCSILWSVTCTRKFGAEDNKLTIACNSMLPLAKAAILI